MKIIVTGKNINVSDKIQAAIEKKFDKFGKYFTDDIKANVVIHPEKAKVKMETTIVARNTIFRASSPAGCCGVRWSTRWCALPNRCRQPRSRPCTPRPRAFPAVPLPSACGSCCPMPSFCLTRCRRRCAANTACLPRPKPCGPSTALPPKKKPLRPGGGSSMKSFWCCS